MSSMTVNKTLSIFIRERRVFEVIARRSSHVSNDYAQNPTTRDPEEFVASCADYESANAVMRRYAELERQRGEVVEQQRVYAETAGVERASATQTNLSGGLMGGCASDAKQPHRY